MDVVTTEADEDCRHQGGGSVSPSLLPPTGETEERDRIPIIPLRRAIRDAAIRMDIMARRKVKSGGWGGSQPRPPKQNLPTSFT
jgi:hypothetical protein